MQLAKNVMDVGLSTSNLEPMLRFWQQDVGLRFDHVLPVRRGRKQYRHDAQGSVIKLNHHAEPLPEAAPSGYRELIIVREGLQKPRRMVDPDGNRVQLVPPGHSGVTQIAVAMGVRSLSEHRSRGVREGFAPITLGDVARTSMILDPDGNWIELSRWASIVGSLSERETRRSTDAPIRA